MSIKLIFRITIDDVLTDVTSAVLSDPTSTYGVKRNDTDAVVAADGTAMTNESVGLYSYTFTAPEPELTYTYWVEWVYNGSTYRQEFSYIDTAATEPVTVEECKLWAHIDSDADDTNIAYMITTARQWAEEYSGRVFLNTTKTLKIDSFKDTMELPGTPLYSVSSITYLDENGDEQTLSSSIYDVDTTTEPGLVTLAYDESWPTTQMSHNAITITYTSGYGTSASNVPSKFKAAIMMLVANMDCHREATTEAKIHEVPFGVRALLSIDRIVPVQGHL